MIKWSEIKFFFRINPIKNQLTFFSFLSLNLLRKYFARNDTNWCENREAGSGAQRPIPPPFPIVTDSSHSEEIVACSVFQHLEVLLSYLFLFLKIYET